MKAVVWQKTGNIEVCEVPKPVPGNNEVLVRVKVATFCKTDLIKIERGPAGVKLPVILGHEVSGVVEAVGEGAEAIEIGQLVALDPPVPCFQCRVCKSGFTHMCPNYRHIGSQIPGGMAEYITIDYRNAFPVPQGVSPTAASLSEPFAVCLEAISQAGGVKGKTVCIFGDGPFGIILCRLARRQQAEQILLFGHHETRMALVKNYDVQVYDTHNVNIGDCIRDHTDNYGAQVLIDTTGSPQILNNAADWLMARGVLVIFTPPGGPCSFDLTRIHFREISIVGSCRSLNKFPETLEAIREDLTRTEALITHKLPIEQAQLGFELLRSNKSTLIKAAIIFEP
jgi:threonine dehydrogenase-like Zn-dependent dehydrogenase